MAGKIKNLIDQIVETRAGKNPVLMNTTRAKLQLKGIDFVKYTNASPDDPVVIAKLLEVAKQLNIVLNN